MDNQLKLKTFTSILEHFHVAVYIINSKAELIYINKAAENMEGLRRTQHLGRSHEEIWGDNAMEQLHSPILHSLHTGEIHYCDNLEWYTPSGRYINAITSSYPVEENGHIVGAIALAEDVEGLKRHLIRQGAFERKQSFPRKKNRLHNGTEYTIDDIIGSSEAIKTAVSMARRFAVKSFPVLIYGETGTGKEMFAQGIHNGSAVAPGPFVPVNCAAIPENLLESLLFGTTKGAFTGAMDKAGLLESAQNGTLFLDEVNSMPMGLQAKLLRALQQREIQRVGSAKAIKINCRIISATNQEPQKAIESGELREDLFYRLSVGTLYLPPLRGRHQDIVELTNFFIGKYNEEMEMALPGATPALLQLFTLYKWPGNIRELSNVIANAIVMSAENDLALDFKHIPHFMVKQICDNFFVSGNAQAATPLAIATLPAPSPAALGGLEAKLDQYEKQLITTALEQTHGKIIQAAQLLEITRQSLYVKMKKYGLDGKQWKKNS